MPAPAGVSSLHSNVAFGSDVNVNDGAVEFVVPVGPPVIDVSGGPVSTVNALVAGVGSGRDSHRLREGLSRGRIFHASDFRAQNDLWDPRGHGFLLRGPDVSYCVVDGAQ